MAGLTKYIGWSATDSDYVCDGTDDHVQINQALSWAAANPGNTVYIRGPYTYRINLPLRIGSSTTFIGDATAVIKLYEGAMWNGGVGLIEPYPSQASKLTGVEITGFAIDGSQADTSHPGVGDPERIYGKGYYNCIWLRSNSRTTPSLDIHIHHMVIRDSLGDGIRLEWCNNVRIHDMEIYNCAHSSVFLTETDNCDIYDNHIEHICNAGVRFDHVSNSKIRSNTIKIWRGTSTCGIGGDGNIQIGNEPSSYARTKLNQNILIYDNTLEDSGMAGITFMDAYGNAGTTAQTVEVYNNLIRLNGWGYTSYTRRGGIAIYKWGNGINIHNNTIENNRYSGIVVNGTIATGVTVRVDSNNITGTTVLSGGGYGINNAVPSSMSVIATNNYVANNAAGSYLNVTASSESTTPITSTQPGDDTTQDDVDNDPGSGDEVDGGTPDADPIVIIYQKGLNKTYHVAGRTAYVNEVPFNWANKKIAVSNSLGQDKCPGAPGWALTDFDLEGAEITFDCGASSFRELHAAISALTKPGRIVVELGGDYSNWQVSGVKADYSTDLRLGTHIPRNFHPYSFMLCMDKPYFESIIQRHRSRFIYNSMQFTADDCYGGNLLVNSSLEEWTPDVSPNWIATSTVEDNEWRVVRYAKETSTFCAVSQTGTTTKVMLSDGNTWRLPSGTNDYGSRGWRGLSWCPEWEMWVACSITGTANKVMVSTDNGDTWTTKTTPVGDQSWNYVLWIPPNDTLANGRVLFFAQAGTGTRVMYSDDQCETFTVPGSVPLASNNWLSAAYSPELHRIVAVAYGGSGTQRVMTSDDYGATWTAQNSPALPLTSIAWADSLSLFVACSESIINGLSQQVIISQTGLADTWTLVDTPIGSTTVTPTGGDVSTVIYQSPIGEEYACYDEIYATGADQIGPTFTIPALTNGHYYRIDNVFAELKSECSRITARIKVTVQFGTGSETTLAEWSNNTYRYVAYSKTLATESAANQAVTVRFYVKTSNDYYEATARNCGFTLTETSAIGTLITYNYNQWRSITWAREVSLLMVVSQTSNLNAAMYSIDGVTWFLGTTPNDNQYTSVCYAPDKNQFTAVGKAGTGNRAMKSDGYGLFVDMAPNGWILANPGQERSPDIFLDGYYSLKINGDGTTLDRGTIKQKLICEANVLYVLSAYGKVSNLTTGSLRVDIMQEESTLKELVWDADCEWTQKKITFAFEVKPTNAYIRIRGHNLNNGAEVYCDKLLAISATDFELSTTGSDIATYGTVDTIPDVIVRGVKAASEGSVTGAVTNFVSDSGTIYTSPQTTYSTQYPGGPSYTLPAPVAGAIYRIDQVSVKLKSLQSGVTAYMKMTYQWGTGTETTLVEWSNNTTSYVQKTSTPLTTAPSNSTLTLRCYLKTTNSSYRATVTEIGYVVSQILNGAAATTNMILWNTADETKKMACCNELLPKYTIELNSDGTGSFVYAEDFIDNTYSRNAYSKSGVTFNTDRNTITIGSGGSIVFKMDSKYPVTGVPAISMFVRDGAPQISIADSSGTGGIPGSYHVIDTNTTTSITDALMTRLLNNENSMKLASKTKYYVKITPYSSGTCEFGSLNISSELSTIDAERFKISATRKANTIAAQVDGLSSAIVTLRYRDLDPVV
jgi:Disaggregatase related/Right handed beta helix region